jgi:hypothetical protein
MRFVPIKTDDQLDLQSLHRVRERWLAQLPSRTHRNLAGVVLANKWARMAWAVLAQNEKYRPPILAAAGCSLTGLQMTPG